MTKTLCVSLKQQQKGTEKDFQDGPWQPQYNFNIVVCLPMEKPFCKTSVQEVKWTTNWPINDLTIILDYKRECKLTLVVFVLYLFMCNNHDKLWNCTWKTSTGQSNLLCPSLILLITVPRHLRHQITRTNGGLTLAGLNFYIQSQVRPKNVTPLIALWREFVGDDPWLYNYTWSLVGWSLRRNFAKPQKGAQYFSA